MNSSLFITGLASIAALLIAAGIVGMVANDVANAFKVFMRASRFLDPISAAVVAAAGESSDSELGLDLNMGVTGEAHDFLGLTKEQYARGVLRLSLVVMAVLAIGLFVIGGNLGISILLGGMSGGLTYVLIFLVNRERLVSGQQEQVRQFPIFLDLFLLMVQSNGNINDAIDTYRNVFGANELAQDLVLLKEDLKSHDMLESFERMRNRVGDENLRNSLGELTQKLRTGTDLQTTLEQQSTDMRTLREELGAQAAERLNAKFQFPVVFAALATLLIFLAPAVAQMYQSGFL